MNLESLLVILAGACVLVLFVQGLVIWQTSKTVKSLTSQMDKQAQRIETDVRDITSKLSELMDNLKPLSEASETLSGNMNEISAMILERSKDFDDLATEVMKLSRDQASKIDYVVTDTAQKFEQTTDVIRTDVMKPALEIAAFIKGIRSGINYLFVSRKASSQESEREEDLFG